MGARGQWWQGVDVGRGDVVSLWRYTSTDQNTIEPNITNNVNTDLDRACPGFDHQFPDIISEAPTSQCSIIREAHRRMELVYLVLSY